MGVQRNLSEVRGGCFVGLNWDLPQLGCKIGNLSWPQTVQNINIDDIFLSSANKIPKIPKIDTALSSGWNCSLHWNFFPLRKVCVVFGTCSATRALRSQNQALKQKISAPWLPSAASQLMSLFAMAFRKDFFNSILNLAVENWFSCLFLLLLSKQMLLPPGKGFIHSG